MGRFNDDEACQRVQRLIIEKAPCMGTDELAHTVEQILAATHEQQEGTDAATVREHITQHMLHPSVRVAGILRSLLDLLNRLQGILMDSDDDGNAVIDAKNVAVYLKVVAEVMQVYKTGDASRLMFSDSRPLA